MLHADQSFAIASTAKIGILYALMREIDLGNESWAGTINSGAQYGNNQGNWLTANTNYTIAQMAQFMIRSSNNWATNRLIDRIGRTTINNHLADPARMNLDVTRIHRYVVGTGAPSAHGNASAYDDRLHGWENLSTPREMASLLRHMAERGRLDQAALDYGIDELSRFRFRGHGGPPEHRVIPGNPGRLPFSTLDSSPDESWDSWEEAGADTGGGDGGILLAQRSGSGVARIGKAFFAFGVLFLVQAFKVGTQHQHFATHIHARGGAVDGQRNRTHRAQVLRDIFADCAIAARGTLHELAILVSQADSEPIELGFAGILDLRRIQPFAATPVEIVDIFVCKGITQ